MYGVAAQWTYDRDILDSVMAEKYISRLTEDVKDPQFLRDMFKKHFLVRSGPSATLIMKPDIEYVSKAEAEEQARQASIKEKLSKEDIQVLLREAAELAAEQDKKADASCLPSLSIDDISPTAISPTVLKE